MPSNAGAKRLSMVVRESDVIKSVDLIFQEAGAQEGILRVSFKPEKGGGDAYYQGATLADWLGFQSAESPGNYYTSLIKARLKPYVPPELGTVDAKCATLLQELIEKNQMAAGGDGRHKPGEKFYLKEAELKDWLKRSFEAVQELHRAQQDLRGE